MNTVYGDIIEVAESGDIGGSVVVLHGCNCFCRMGAGVALRIAKAWPEAECADLSTMKGDKSKLGHWSEAHIKRFDTNFTVINLYTQYRYGKSSESNFDYRAFEKGLKGLAEHFSGTDTHFLYPLIGAGYGGGQWSLIEKIIEEELSEFKRTLVKLPPV